jgi:hypothetical protein
LCPRPVLQDIVFSDVTVLLLVNGGGSPPEFSLQSLPAVIVEDLVPPPSPEDAVAIAKPSVVTLADLNGDHALDVVFAQGGVFWCRNRFSEVCAGCFGPTPCARRGSLQGSVFYDCCQAAVASAPTTHPQLVTSCRHLCVPAGVPV